MVSHMDEINFWVFFIPNTKFKMYTFSTIKMMGGNCLAPIMMPHYHFKSYPIHMEHPVVVFQNLLGRLCHPKLSNQYPFLLDWLTGQQKLRQYHDKVWYDSNRKAQRKLWFYVLVFWMYYSSFGVLGQHIVYNFEWHFGPNHLHFIKDGSLSRHKLRSCI